ncbi:MAG TPA: IS21-like element helper ATPase IstB [Burkholderiaceae bacterium]|nr:IS21-like element helper ATPase IstB [Burkholderiaceae bacterium]
MRLTAMASAYQLQLEQPRLHQLPFDDRFAMLVEHEVSERERRKLKRIVAAASLPEPAALEDLDERASRGLDKSQIAQLASCEWVRRHQNLIIQGATGVGKTWLAAAFGAQACRLKMTVLFWRMSELCSTLSDAALDGSLARFKKSLVKPDLLILDDFGIGEISAQNAQVLLDVVDRRVRSGALLFTSQYQTEKWHGFFPDATVADAILDRVVHQAHRVTLKGESMRKIRAKKQMEAELDRGTRKT